MDGWGPKLTLLTFLVHVVAGCCAHHGHAAISDQAVNVAEERSSAASHSAAASARSAQPHVCAWCTEHEPGDPQPCRDTACSFWVSSDSKLIDFAERADGAPFFVSVPALSPSPARWQTVHAPVVLQTGCPVSADQQPWLQSWLA